MINKEVENIGCLSDYGCYLEATAQTKAKQSEVDKLADEVNESWWSKNKHRFSK